MPGHTTGKIYYLAWFKHKNRTLPIVTADIYKTTLSINQVCMNLVLSIDSECSTVLHQVQTNCDQL